MYDEIQMHIKDAILLSNQFHPSPVRYFVELDSVDGGAGVGADHVLVVVEVCVEMEKSVEELLSRHNGSACHHVSSHPLQHVVTTLPSVDILQPFLSLYKMIVQFLCYFPKL